MTDNPNFPVGTAAVSWIDSNGVPHIRVYSTDGYTVIERCQDGGSVWQTGQFSAPGSHVSATCWVAPDGIHLRVFCTGDDATTEWCCDPTTGWTKGDYTTV